MVESPPISDVARRHLRLQRAHDVGPIRFRKLREHFGSVDAVLEASRSELQNVDGIGPKTAESIFAARHDPGVDAEIERASACGVRILCQDDADYPLALLKIDDPPICLYVRGVLHPTDSVALAIVGTRRCSNYGREQAERFGGLLARVGFTIVSGLARGVDGAAHRAAVEAAGRTIAVLGNGLAHVYPQEHTELASRIVNSGALISELPIDAAPDTKNFPPRNRIIAGLSLGVLVIEAGKNSGALITARLAADYNREVFAIPGRVDQPELSAGVHALIRDGGGKLVTSLEDILDELPAVGEIMRRGMPSAASDVLDHSSIATGAGLTALEQAVWNAILEGNALADSVCSRVSFDTGKVMATLTALELKGLVRRVPGGRFEARAPADGGEGHSLKHVVRSSDPLK